MLIGYRKFLVALCCWASTSLLCMAGLLTGGEYVTSIGLIVALYGTANTVGKFAGGAQ